MFLSLILIEKKVSKSNYTITNTYNVKVSAQEHSFTYLDFGLLNESGKRWFVDF